MSPYAAVCLVFIYTLHAVSLSHLCPSKFSGKKTVVIWALLILASSGIGFVLLKLFPGGLGINFAYFTTTVLNVVALIFVSKERFSKTLFFFMAYVQAFTVIMFAAGYVAFRFWSADNVAKLIISAPMHVALTVFCIYLSNGKLKLVSQGLENGWWPLDCLSGLLLIYLGYLSLRVYDVNYRLEELAYFGLLLTVIIAVYYVFFHTIRLMQNSAEKQCSELQIQFLLRQVETMQESINDAKRIRHDARHHNTQILEYLQNSEYEALRAYLGEYEKEYLEPHVIKICENLAADSILSAYTRKAKQIGIEVKLNVSIERDIGIADIDIVAILANLMENAICGCLKSGKDEQSIYVYIARKVKKLVIYVCNTAGNNLAFENGLPLSQSGGGIGVTSILHSAARYDGEYDFRLENGSFICQIMLNIPKRSTVTT